MSYFYISVSVFHIVILFQLSSIYIVVLYQGLNLHFFFDKCAWTLFPAFIVHMYILLTQVPVQVFCLLCYIFLKAVHRCFIYSGYKALVKYIYIYCKHLSVTCILLFMSFDKQFTIFTTVQFKFYYIVRSFCDLFKISFPTPRSKICFPIFSLKKDH